jgi:diguanylate cyclase (GGDEF)-like protein
MGILMTGLDHPKHVNDSYGHREGDEVLRETVKRMRASTRVYNAIGRHSGEEFLIVLPGCDIASAQQTLSFYFQNKGDVPCRLKEPS